MNRLARPEYDEGTLFIRRGLPNGCFTLHGLELSITAWVDWSRLDRLLGVFFGGVVISRERKVNLLP
jgi:hypothetical protein